jgi:hypothetical protein
MNLFRDLDLDADLGIVSDLSGGISHLSGASSEDIISNLSADLILGSVSGFNTEQLSRDLFLRKEVLDSDISLDRASCGNRIHLLDRYKKRIVGLPCKKWDCPDCGKQKMSEVRKYIRENIKDWSTIRMLTLTVVSGDKHWSSPDDHRNVLQEAWRRFLIYMKRYRKNLDRLRYIRVNEMHENGYYHIHILVDLYIPQDLAYQVWNRILSKLLPGSIIESREGKQLGSVNLELLGSGDCARSVASKYAMKMRISNYITKLKKHLKRFRVWSHSMSLPALHKKKPKSGRWVLLTKKYTVLTLNLLNNIITSQEIIEKLE